MSSVALACRALLVVVFVVSAVSKLRGRDAFPAFVRSVRRMKVVPPKLVRPVAVVVVTAEVAAAVLLAVPLRPTGMAGFVITAGLLLSFTAGIGYAIRHGSNEPCRCFGRSEVPLGPRHVIRNSFLIVVSLVGAGAILFGGDVGTGQLVIAAGAGLIVGGLVVVLDDLIYLFQPSTPAP